MPSTGGGGGPKGDDEGPPHTQGHSSEQIQ